MGCGNRVSGTNDGANFRSFGIDAIKTGRAPHGLCEELE